MKSIYRESEYQGTQYASYKISVEAYWDEKHRILFVETWVEKDGDRVDSPGPGKHLEFQESHSQSIRRAIELFDAYYYLILHGIYEEEDSMSATLAEAHTRIS